MNRRTILIIVIAATALLIIGYTALPLAMLPLTNYGDPVLYNETTDTLMSAGDVLNVQDGDTLVAWLVDDTATQHKPTDLDWTVTLRRADTDAWIEDGGDASKVGELYPSVVGDSVRWWFNLESCLEGTFDYVVFWFAMIGDTEVDAGGYSQSFAVVNTAPPVYDDAVFVTEPADVMICAAGQLAVYATWKVDYDGSFTASVAVDGVEDWTQTYAVAAGDDLVMYPVNTDVEGTQSIVLTVIPSSGDNPLLVSEAVTVTVVAASTTTPTTTTDTETTTTDTGTAPTTEPDGEEMEFPVVWVVLGVIIVIAIVVKVAK